MFGTAGSMYIEVFLADNLLMNLLILRLAAALLSKRAEPKRTLCFALAGAAAAAGAAAGLRFLYSLPAKLLLTALMAFALERIGGGERPGVRARRYLAAFLATLLSAAAVGGAVLLCSIIIDEAIPSAPLGALSLRAALAGALSALSLPRLVRRLLRRAERGSARLSIEIAIKGGERLRIECAALIDTGNTLWDPLTALPVVVLSRIKYPKAAELASLPLPVRTATGRGVIPALRPEKLLVNGRSADALVAFSQAETALVPPCLVFEDPGSQGIDPGVSA